MAEDVEAVAREALLALAERVEAATGPDRALDRDIADSLGFGPDDTWERRRSIPGVIKDMAESAWIKNGRIRESARYTASLDAAMTLVPETADAAGERFRLETYNSPGVLPDHVRASAWVAGAPRVYAATPALALTAAALRARAQARP